MKWLYDEEADVLYIRFNETEVTTRHLTDEIAFDYDHEGRVAGIEILAASRVISDPRTVAQNRTGL